MTERDICELYWAFNPGTPMCQERGGLALVRSKSLSQPSAMVERHLLAEGLSLHRSGSSEHLHGAVRRPPRPFAHPDIRPRSPPHLPCCSWLVTEGMGEILVPLVLCGLGRSLSLSKIGPQPWAVKEPASLPLSRSFLRTAPPHVMGPRWNPRLGKLGPHPSSDSSEMMCQHGSFNYLARSLRLIPL